MNTKIQAQQLAKYGRNGDSMLVHMTPKEVGGIMSVAPGAVTQNPDTGLPEMFNLGSVLPALLGTGVGYMTGMPWLGAAIAGGGTTMATGNLGSGILAGLGAYAGASGLDSMFPSEAVGMTGAEAVASSATNMTDLGLSTAGEASPGFMAAGEAAPGQYLMSDPSVVAQTAQTPSLFSQNFVPQAVDPAAYGTYADADPGIYETGTDYLGNIKDWAVKHPKIAGLGALTAYGALSEPEQLEYEGINSNRKHIPEAEKREVSYRPYHLKDRVYGDDEGEPALFNTTRGFDDGGDVGDDSYGSWGDADPGDGSEAGGWGGGWGDSWGEDTYGIGGGGNWSADGGHGTGGWDNAGNFGADADLSGMGTPEDAAFVDSLSESTTVDEGQFGTWGDADPGIYDYARGDGSTDRGYYNDKGNFVIGNFTPNEITFQDWTKAGIRGAMAVAPMGGAFDLFGLGQAGDKVNQSGLFDTTPVGEHGDYGNNEQFDSAFQNQAILPPMGISPGAGGPSGGPQARQVQYRPHTFKDKIYGDNEGAAKFFGTTTGFQPMSSISGFEAGGYVDAVADSDKKLIVMAATAALKGQHPAPEEAIQKFVETFGGQAFQALQTKVAQGEQGKVSGPGNGRDDAIPAMINGQQPAALSDGEYVVPADVVSGLGDGSTDAGVRKLDELKAKVRQAKSGGKQPRKISQSLMPQ